MAERLYPVGFIAKLLNVSDRRVQQMVKEGVIPKSERGKYDLIACVQGYVRYLQDLAVGKAMVPTDIHATRARLQSAQAELAEMEVKKLSAKLFDGDLISGWWAKIVNNAKLVLLAIPSRAAPVLFACKTVEEVRSTLQAMIYEALNALAGYDPRTNTSGSNGVDAAAKPERKPVGRRKPKAKPGGKRGAGKVAKRTRAVSAGNNGRGKRSAN